MRREVFGMQRCAMAFQVRRARCHLKALRRQNPRLHARIVQRADAKQQVGTLL
ncbi:hypothetical protein D3C76_1884170 [compost metagenome]